METRGLSPRKFSLRARLDYASLLLGCWGVFVCFRRRGGGGGGEKAFPRKQIQAQAPQPHGRPQRRPRRLPRPAPAPGPAHSRHFAPNFAIAGGGFSCLSPFPSPVSPRSWVQPLPVTLPRLNETLPSFIYLPRPSPTLPLPLLPMWMMESARTETH